MIMTEQPKKNEIPWPDADNTISWSDNEWELWEEHGWGPVGLKDEHLHAIREYFSVPEWLVSLESLRTTPPKALEMLAESIEQLGGVDKVHRFVAAIADHGIRIEAYLGGGAWSHVFRAHSEEHDKLTALKILKPPYSQEWRRRFDSEAAILRKLSPNMRIGKPLSIIQEVEHLLFVQMEYYDAESLSSCPTPVRGDHALSLAEHVLEKLATIHELGIVHRDLHAGNILLHKEGPIIVDFGVARDLESVDYYKTFKPVGAMSHCAPECWLNPSEASPSTDIFALGVLLYRLLTGHYPFWEDTYIRLYEAIKAGKFPPATDYVGHLLPMFNITLNAMLHTDPQRRLSSAREAIELVKHTTGLFRAWQSYDPKQGTLGEYIPWAAYWD